MSYLVLNGKLVTINDKLATDQFGGGYWTITLNLVESDASCYSAPSGLEAHGNKTLDFYLSNVPTDCSLYFQFHQHFYGVGNSGTYNPIDASCRFKLIQGGSVVSEQFLSLHCDPGTSYDSTETNYSCVWDKNQNGFWMYLDASVLENRSHSQTSDWQVVAQVLLTVTNYSGRTTVTTIFNNESAGALQPNGNTAGWLTPL